MVDENTNFASTIAAEARRPIPLDVSDRTFVALPDGYRVEVLDPWKDDPTRLKGTTRMDTTASFIEGVNGVKQADSRVYCDLDRAKGSARFVGVINDHGRTSAGGDYRDCRVVYSPKQAPEWSTWLMHDRKPFQQAAFASFIEDNMADIATVDGRPSGSDMLAMALTLEITQEAAFRSAVRLQSGGVKLSYVAQEDDATLKTMQVFDRFALGLAPFEGGPSYRVDAKLRYRLQGSVCSFWYELVRPDLVVRDAVREIVTTVHEETELPVLMGAPE